MADYVTVINGCRVTLAHYAVSTGLIRGSSMRPHSVIGIDRYIDVKMIGSTITSPGKLTRGRHLNSCDTLHLTLARPTVERPVT